MRFKERDICYDFNRLSEGQQNFFLDLVWYLDNKLHYNTKLYQLIVGPLFDCLQHPWTRCIMEAIEECGWLSQYDTWWQALKQQSQDAWIISRSDLKLIRMWMIEIWNDHHDQEESSDSLASSVSSCQPYIVPQPSTPKGLKLKSQKYISYYSIIKALEKLDCKPTGVTKGSHETRQRDDYVFHVVRPHHGQKNMCSQRSLKLTLLWSHLSYDEIAAVL